MVGGRVGDPLMFVVFRVDASSAIGSGHVMRCLTLADALAGAGSQCCFVMRQKPRSLEEAVRGRGHYVLMLSPAEPELSVTPAENEPPHAAWLGTRWEFDAAETLAALAGLEPDWLVVDHYALDYRWESLVSGCAKRLMVIDDLADREHDCDLLLDQNLGRWQSDYDGLVPDRTTRLVGSGYALLRPEFAQARTRSIRARQSRELGNILISMGGADVENVTGDVLRELETIEEIGSFHVTVVMGAACPHVEGVSRQADSMRLDTRIIVNANNMAELMAEADFAIGAAGGSAWERCCLGLPTLLVIMAANQRPGAEALQRAGAALCIGSQESIHETLPSALQKVLMPGALNRMSSAAAAICDGRGAQRVVNALTEVESG